MKAKNFTRIDFFVVETSLVLLKGLISRPSSDLFLFFLSSYPGAEQPHPLYYPKSLPATGKILGFRRAWSSQNQK